MCHIIPEFTINFNIYFSGFKTFLVKMVDELRMLHRILKQTHFCIWIHEYGNDCIKNCAHHIQNLPVVDSYMFSQFMILMLMIISLLRAYQL